jgi:hypothetical protein
MPMTLVGVRPALTDLQHSHDTLVAPGVDWVSTSGGRTTALDLEGIGTICGLDSARGARSQS